METEILIVGGGLSGLSLARKLHAADRSFHVIEGRDRFGGRILSHETGDASYDLGPTWFWPGQPRIARLIADLGLTLFEQFAQGAMCLEDEQGQVHRGQGWASMEGSYRLDGGFGALITAMVDELPKNALSRNTALRSIRRTETGIIALAGDKTITAKQVVLAIPPRVAAGLDFTPALPPEATAAMREVPTWMAGHAKAVAMYDTAFWRDDGLSGDAMSRIGPLMEIHDASPSNGGPFALFGFIGVPATARENEAQLREATLAQLGRIFGPQALEPKELIVKDWAYDPFTSTALDKQPLYAHPHYGLPQDLSGIWDGALVFGSTEVASQFGGFLEGAIEASELVIAQLG